MARHTEVQAMKVAATSNFKILDPEFREIHDAGNTELHGLEPETFDIFASFSTKYEGVPPTSYRVLNAIVLDWVEDNKDKLTEIVAPKVIEHYAHEESAIDTSEFEEHKSDFIWEEQVDYMPMVHEDENRLYFELELVFDIQETEKDDSES